MAKVGSHQRNQPWQGWAMALFLSTLDQIVAPNVISCSLASRRDDMSSTLRFAA